MYKISAI